MWWSIWEMRLYFSFRRLVYWRAPFAVAARLLGLAGPRRPAAETARFDGNMVGTAVLLMTRFFAKPIVFDIVNKVKRYEVWTAHMGVTRRLPSRFESSIRNAPPQLASCRLAFGNSRRVTFCFVVPTTQPCTTQLLTIIDSKLHTF